MKTRIILAVSLMLVIIGMMSLVPESPSTAYPIPTPKPPTYTFAPEWASYTCEIPQAYVKLAWWNPQPGTGSMSNGLLYVWGSGITRTLLYDGWYTDVEGKIVHEWHASYPRPLQPYYLNAYVRNISGTYYWVEDIFYPPCFGGDVYLPIIFNKRR